VLLDRADVRLALAPLVEGSGRHDPGRDDDHQADEGRQRDDQELRVNHGSHPTPCVLLLTR
jgi:hypothetical protein